MVRYLTAVVISSLLFVSVLHASTAEPIKIRESIRLVVISDEEGIHYQSGCGFYELRALLADAADQLSTTIQRPSEPLYEIHFIGKIGTGSVFIGDHWLASETGTALLSARHFGRIAELIDMRRGSGVSKTKIAISIRQSTRRIQDPLFKENNRCTERY